MIKRRVHRAEIIQLWRTPVVAACYGTKTEYAEILVDHERFSDVECAEYARDGLISLLQGFSDVTTLKLSPSTAELLSYIPKFLEQQASPFKRLETLRLRHNKVPDAVINYFLKGRAGNWCGCDSPHRFMR
ncbi:hypothetical protein LINPERHAP1_LOCUS14497 [Linum perenne]